VKENYSLGNIWPQIFTDETQIVPREECEDGENRSLKARRAGIFVAWPNKMNKAPPGATSSGERTEYAAPMGLEFRWA
jgi:hypothetical protein